MTVVARRPLDASAVTEAASLIASHIRRTPTERSEALSVLSGREVILKLENLQKTGAFKIRGALHALLRKDARERVNGVVTASAGNHGQGVAYAAQLLGVPATVVLPHGVPLAKLTAIQRTGAEALLLGESYDDAHAAALDIARERKRAYIHAFDDDDVIAGQGTLALELLDDVRDLDTLVVPVGGGGLIAGVALAASARTPRPRIVGVQAAGASAFAESFAGGAVVERTAATIADGIAVRRPAERTLSIVKRLVDDVITVSDEAIARSIVVLLERTKLLAEGAGAAALAAVLELDGRIGAGRKVGVVISGGNIDPNLLGKALQQGLVSAGRYLAFRTWLEDKPGMLHELTGLLAREHINILHVGIHRLGPYALLGRVGLDVIVDTRDRAHADAVLSLLRTHGFAAEELFATAPTHT
ncbi:MAG: threonine ammonia-lyase [Chloroflexi bacterium 13_1_40CM_68_21]|nr:MAG: threonine ammonia-lyase [Chloroflexi bacterium 13_1_40CM_68_21]